jgi:hypothetical protein
MGLSLARVPHKAGGVMLAMAAFGTDNVALHMDARDALHARRKTGTDRSSSQAL